MTPLNATKVDLCVPRKVEQLLISIKVSECVCVFLRPFTMKASSVWINWNTREQINKVQLIKFFSYAKSLQHYFRVKHLTFLTNHFILFLHQKRAKLPLNQCVSRYQNIRASFTIIRHSPHTAQHPKLIYLWHQVRTRSWQSNFRRLW